MTTETTTLPCSVCRKPLERMDGEADWPYAGTVFTTEGHYGSTMFDAVFGGENLRLIICDDCLDGMKSSSAIHRVVHATEEVPGRQVIWGSAEDTGDNPKNDLRLANERRLEEFLEQNGKHLEESQVRALLNSCNWHSGKGLNYNPAAGRPQPAPAGEAVI